MSPSERYMISLDEGTEKEFLEVRENLATKYLGTVLESSFTSRQVSDKETLELHDEIDGLVHRLVPITREEEDLVLAFMKHRVRVISCDSSC